MSLQGTNLLSTTGLTIHAQQSLASLGPAKPPRKNNLTGEWELSWDKSDGMGNMLKAYGVGVMTRRLIGSVNVQSSIVHTPSLLTVTNTSKLGTETWSYVLDDKEHDITYSYIGYPLPTRSWMLPSGDIYSHMKFGAGRSEDIRHLHSRTVMRQVTTVYDQNDAPMSTTQLIWLRVETEQERVAAEEAEEAAASQLKVPKRNKSSETRMRKSSAAVPGPIKKHSAVEVSTPLGTPLATDTSPSPSPEVAGASKPSQPPAPVAEPALQNGVHSEKRSGSQADASTAEKDFVDFAAGEPAIAKPPSTLEAVSETRLEPKKLSEAASATPSASSVDEDDMGEDEEDTTVSAWNPLADLSGDWVADETKSDSLEPFLKEMELSWMIRKVILKLSVVTTIEHSMERFDITEKSSANEQLQEIPLDGVKQKKVGTDGKPYTISAENVEGGVLVCTDLAVGTVKDTRTLLSRTEFKQVTEMWKNGQMTHRMTRFNKRVGESSADAARADQRWRLLQEAAVKRKEAEAVRQLKKEQRSQQKASAAKAAEKAAAAFAESKTSTAVEVAPVSPVHVPVESQAQQQLPKQLAAAPLAVPEPEPDPEPTFNPLHDLSGEWMNIDAKSDSIEQLLKELEVSWVMRKVVMKLVVTYNIKMNDKEFKSTDTHSAGESTVEFKLDGNKYDMVGQDGKPFKISGSYDVETGVMTATTELAICNIVDRRSMVNRKEMKKVTEVWKKGVKTHTMTSYLKRVNETPEQAAAGNKLWKDLEEAAAQRTQARLKYEANKTAAPATLTAAVTHQAVPVQAAQTAPKKASAPTTALGLLRAQDPSETESLPDAPAPIVIEDAPAPPEEEPAFDPLQDLSGDWGVDLAKSDPLEPFLKELDVPWVLRKVIVKMVVTTTITHTEGNFSVFEKSSASEQLTEIMLDGRKRDALSADGKPYKICGTVEEDSGTVVVTSDLANGAVVVDKRRLINRMEYMQVTEVWKKDKKTHTMISYKKRINETPHQFARAELRWSELQAAKKVRAEARAEWEAAQMPGGAKVVHIPRAIERTTTVSASHQSASMPRVPSERMLTDALLQTPPRTPIGGSVSPPLRPLAGTPGRNTPRSGGGETPRSQASSLKKVQSALSLDMSSDDEIPEPFWDPLKELSGNWKSNDEKSDSLEPFLKELDVAWVLRKVFMNMKIVTTLTHTRDRFTVMEVSSAGENRTELLLDGVRREKVSSDGKKTYVSATYDPAAGSVCVSTWLDVALVKDTRYLVSRTEMKQVTEVFKGGKKTLTMTRFNNREETPEEAAMGAAHWLKLLEEKKETEEARTKALAKAQEKQRLRDDKLAKEDAAEEQAEREQEEQERQEAGLSSVDVSESDEEDEELDSDVSYVNYSGTWTPQNDADADAALDALVKAMGVSAIQRRLSKSFSVVHVIKHTSVLFKVTNRSSAGEFVQAVPLDGKPHKINQWALDDADMTATFDSSAGSITLKTVWGNGMTLVDSRTLVNRTTLKQVTNMLSPDQLTVTRFYKKQETEAQRVAGDLAAKQEAKQKEERAMRIESARMEREFRRTQRENARKRRAEDARRKEEQRRKAEEKAAEAAEAAEAAAKEAAAAKEIARAAISQPRSSVQIKKQVEISCLVCKRNFSRRVQRNHCSQCSATVCGGCFVMQGEDKKIDMALVCAICWNSSNPGKKAVVRGYWVPSKEASGCMRCALPFNFFRRKHHCRRCGLVVCASCSPFDAVGAGGKMARHCNDCLDWYKAEVTKINEAKRRSKSMRMNASRVRKDSARQRDGTMFVVSAPNTVKYETYENYLSADRAEQRRRALEEEVTRRLKVTQEENRQMLNIKKLKQDELRKKRAAEVAKQNKKIAEARQRQSRGKEPQLTKFETYADYLRAMEAAGYAVPDDD